MSVTAYTGQPFIDIAEGAASGLVGTIGVQLKDIYGNTVIARTTAAISEIAPGVYEWQCAAAPEYAGEYTILWDDGSGHFATDDLTVTSPVQQPYNSPPTSGIWPDLAGFVGSRDVLYANFGIYMAFLIPQEPVYDDTMPVGAFGEALDPWATPASGGINSYASAYASGLLVTRPYGGRGQVRDQQGQTPIGIVPEEELGVNIRPSDYAVFGPGGSMGEATHVFFWGQMYQIREWRADGIGGLQRYVVYITQESNP